MGVDTTSLEFEEIAERLHLNAGDVDATFQACIRAGYSHKQAGVISGWVEGNRPVDKGAVRYDIATEMVATPIESHPVEVGQDPEKGKTLDTEEHKLTLKERAEKLLPHKEHPMDEMERETKTPEKEPEKAPEKRPELGANPPRVSGYMPGREPEKK